MNVGIIGFGVSGIATCRWALHYGFIPEVFEKNSNIGGCWFSKSYPNVQLQTNKYSYCFSDIPMKDSVGLYPTVDEVLNYLDEYVEYHSLKKYVNFNTSVKSIEHVDNSWKVVYDKDGSIHEKIFGHLVISTGFYSESNTSYSLSRYYHVEDFSPNGKYFKDYGELFRDKDVVVIGNGPSGVDLSCLAIESDAKSVKLFYRNPRWIFSRYIFGLSLHFLTNRFFLKLAHVVPFCIVRPVLIILFMLPIYWYGLDRDIEFPKEPVSRNNLTLNDKFYFYKNIGRLEYIKEPIVEISEERVKSSKRLYNYDLIIDARGYKNEVKLLGMSSIPKLYKHIIYPGFNNLGLVGYAATFNWIAVSDLQARWLMEYFQGKISTGSLENQREWIGIESRKRADYHDLAYHIYDYCDMLANDIGVKKPRVWVNVPVYNQWSNSI
jgi:dimethylaniline monooxygenase (N-oxide forming)